MHTETLFKIEFPSRVVGVGCVFDFGMSLDGYTGSVEQMGFTDFAFSVLDFAVEDPVTMTNGAEVFFFDPLGGLVRMPAFGPAPQGFEDGVVHFGKGLFTDDVPVIVGPAPNERI